MIQALMPLSERRLLAEALSRTLLAVGHDSFQVVLDIAGNRLALVPVEVPVPHPDTSGADVDRISIEPARESEFPGMRWSSRAASEIASIELARTLIAFAAAEQLQESEILGVQLGPSIDVHSRYFHPAEQGALASAPALALTDVGLRISTIDGQRLYIATEGYFAVPYLDNVLPDGWEGTVQYLPLNATGNLAA